MARWAEPWDINLLFDTNFLVVHIGRSKRRRTRLTMRQFERRDNPISE
jgi:hypothetical protein